MKSDSLPAAGVGEIQYVGCPALVPFISVGLMGQVAPSSPLSPTLPFICSRCKVARQAAGALWSKLVGAGRANEGLRSTWQEELDMVCATMDFNMCVFTEYSRTTCLSIVRTGKETGNL